MAQKIEKATHEDLTSICGPEFKTPNWLTRPGRLECRDQWPLVQEIYRALTGRQLPDSMPRRERRKVDGVFREPSGQKFIFELDEKQHFNEFRETTIGLYPESLQLGFSRDRWTEQCQKKKKLEGGGFAKPKPPLFPDENGRHRQRAFRDALTDILPLEFGFAPTIRLADFEVRDWMFGPDAVDHMGVLLAERLGV